MREAADCRGIRGGASVVDPTIDPEEEPADTTAEEPGEMTDSIQPDAVAATEAAVSVKTVRKEKQTDDDGKEQMVEVDGESSDAEVHFTEGCVNGGKLVEGSDLTFKVEPGAGRIVKEVSYLLSDAKEGAKRTVLSSPYKIAKGTLVPSTGAKSVTIYVETAAAGYKVSFADTDDCADDSYDIYAMTKDKDGNDVLAKDPVADAGVTVSTEDEAKEFALVLKDAEATKLVDVSLNGTALASSDTDVEELTKLTDSASEKVYGYLFTVDPADCGIVSNAAETVAEVKVNVRNLYKLTVSNIDLASVVTGTAELKAPAAPAAGAKQYNFTAAGALSDADKAKLVEDEENYSSAKLVFDVQHSKSYKVNVSAKIGEADVTVDEPVKVEVKDEAAGKETMEYAIDLSQDALTLDANKTLAIKISTEVSDSEDAEGVTTITFEAGDGSSLANVDVKEKGKSSFTAAQLSAGVRAAQEKTTYILQIQPKPGYTVTKGVGDDEETDDVDETTKDAAGTSLENKQYVSIVSERKYGDDEVTYSYNVGIGEDGTASDIAIDLKGNDKNYLEDPSGAGDAKDFTTTSVKVTIGSTLDKNTGEKLVAFADGLKADDKSSYAITSTGVVKDEYVESAYGAYEDDTWAIAKGTDMLTFTVTSATAKPVVSYTVGSDAAVPVDASTADNGIYTYNIPANVFAIYDTEDAAATTNIITIGKTEGESTTAKVTVDDTDNLLAVGGFVYKINNVPKTETLAAAGTETALSNAPKIGDTIEMVFTAKKGVTFGEVTYQVGETTGTATIGATEDGNATATIKAAVTGPVVVNAKTTAPYYVVLSTDAESSLEGDNGAYAADYTEKNINIQLYKADSNVAEDFYDVVVKDGDATALTKAKMSGTTAAKIESISEKEAGHLLTVEVAKKEGTKIVKYQATLKVSASSDEVTVTGQDGKAISEDAVISVMPDSSLTFKVTPKEGANLKDLMAEIRSVDGKTDAAAKKLFAADAAIDENGEISLTVAPQKEAAGQVLLCIYNPNAKTEDGKVDKNKTPLKGGKITLDITAPLVNSAQIKGLNVTAGAAGNREVSVNLGLDFANKKSAPMAPATNWLYYKVELKNVKTSAEGVKPVSKDLVTFIQIDENNGSYNGADVAGFYKKNLVESYTVSGKTAEETAKMDIPDVITADATVTLVQSLKGTELTTAAKEGTDYVAGDKKELSLTTLMPLYETKLGVKKLNGASVLTGQRIDVAAPSFTKGVSYTNVSATFVNAKTGKEFGNTYSTTSGGVAFETGVNRDGTVWVAASDWVDVNTWKNNDFFKNMGVKITADAPEQGYRASAVVKISVKQGIYSVKADERKASLPRELYQDGKGNVKSVKIPVLLNADRQTKPAKSTLVWSITGDGGSSISSLDRHMQDAISGAKPLVSVKNGTIKVDKNYKRAATKTNPDADTFYVTAKANDFAENNASCIWEFTITGQNQTIGKLVVVDGNNKVKDAASLKAEDFQKSGNEGKLFIAAVKSGVPDPAKNAGYNPKDFIPVTFKAGGKLVTLEPINSVYKARINFSKPGSTKITATTVDGGKGAGTKAELTITVGAYEKLGLTFTRSDDVVSGPEVSALEYYGGSNERYEISLAYYDGKEWQSEYDYKNVKVAVKGAKYTQDKFWAKNTQQYMGAIVGVTDKSGKATVTLTDTATKNTTVYTIENKGVSQIKAPSIKLYDPKKVTFDTEKITWQVTDKNNDNYIGSYVKLTPDYTVDISKNPAYWWLGEGEKDEYGITTTPAKILKIDENGRFALDTVDGPRLPYSGAYKMVATVGTMAGGEFVASAKDVKLNFSIPKSKYNDKLKVTAGYTLDTKAGTVTKIVVNTDSDYTVSDAMNVIMKDQDVDKHANHFTDYFVVTRDDDGAAGTMLWNKTAKYEGKYAYIGLKNDLNAAQIAYITDMKNKAAAEDRIGYITVKNGTYSQDVQLKISFTDKGKFDGSAAIFENTKSAVTVDVQILNKKAPVEIANVRISSEDNKNFATKAEVCKTDNTKITLTSKNPIASEKYEVKLDVIPKDSVFAYTEKMLASGEKGAKALTEKEIFDSYSVPATLKIEVKALDSKKITTVKGTSFVLSSKTYTEKNGNGYVQAATTGTGSYQVDVPYTLGGSNLYLSEKAADKAVTVGLEGNDVTIDEKAKKTEPLVTATVAEVTVNGETKDVIRLNVSKKALNTLHAAVVADKRAKVVADFGKKVSVPLTIQATNGKDKAAAETVKINLTIPKQPMSFADVQKLVNDQKTGMAKIKTAGTTTEAILGSLVEKIGAKAEAVVPADTDVRIGAVTLKAIKDDEDDTSDLTNPDVQMGKGKVEASLVLTDLTAAKDADATLKWTYDLGINASMTSDSATLAETVAGIIENATLSYKNDTTAKKLEDAIKGLDDLADYVTGARRGNISIKVTYFTKTNATTKTPGSISATVRVLDLVTGDEEVVDLNNKVITSPTNIVEAYKAVQTALEETKAGKLTAIIQKCAGDETAIKAEIEKIATEKANNPDIKITVDPCTYTAPVKAEDADDKTDHDGKLSFTLKMEENGRVKELTGATTVPVSQADKYVDIDTAMEKVSATILKENGDFADDVETALTTAIGNKTDKKEIVEAIKTAVEVLYADVLNGTEAGGIYGYGCAVEDADWKAATATEKGKITFKVVIYPLANENSKQDAVSVDAKEIGAVDKNNITEDELRDLLGSLDTASKTGYAATATAAVDAARKVVTDKLGCTDFTAQTGYLKGATLAVTQTKDTEAEKVGGEGDDKDKIKGIKVDIKITKAGVETPLYSDDGVEFTFEPAPAAP